jgi:peptide/nickel transport system substrate-binding protein
MMIEMRKKILLGFFILGLFFLTNYSQTTITVFDPVNNPGLYIVETSYLDFATLDTASNYESGGSGLNSLICETLYDYSGNKAEDLVPVLASGNPVWSADGLQVNITLKQGIKFQDGVDFNAWVYKYSIDRVAMISDINGPTWMLSPIKGFQTMISYVDGNTTQAYDYLSMGGIKVLSDYEIQFNFDYVYSPIIAALTFQVGCAISPKAVIDNRPILYVANDLDDNAGMVDLATWFPDLAGNYTRLGLPNGHLSTISGVVPYSGDGTYAQHIWFLDHQIGTGPWSLTTKNSTYIQLDRNTNWWNASAYHTNAPTRIIIKLVADSATRYLDLVNGYSDAMGIDNSILNQAVFPDGSTKNESVKTYKKDTFTIGFAGFNLRDGDQIGLGYIDKYSTSSAIWENDTTLANAGYLGYAHLNKTANSTNPFTVLKFRQAFLNSFNYSKYLESAYGGFALRLEGLIPNGMFAHQDDLIETGYIPQFNLTLAKALFTELGWRGSITLGYNTGNNIRKSMGEMFKSSIEGMNIGINIVIKEFTWPEYLSQYNKIPLQFLGWAPDFADPDNYITPFVHSTKGYYSARINYANPILDSLIDAASAEINPSIRVGLYRNLEQYIAEESVFVYLAQIQSIQAFWYQWNGYNTSGSLNPMSLFVKVHFMDKVSQDKVPVIDPSVITTSVMTSTTTPITNTTTVTYINTTTVTSVDTTTVTETVTATVTPSSSLTSPTSSTQVPSTTSRTNVIATSIPGFEIFSVIGLLIVGILTYRRRK